MRIIDCTKTESNTYEYRHFVTPVPFHLIPARLAERIEIKIVEPLWFKTQVEGWGKTIRNDLDEVTEITGLDKFYWKDGDNCFILSFKPLIGIKTVTGMGFIESYTKDIRIENTPTIDYDYQDENFNEEHKRVQNIIRSVNY